jgi:beta-glucosidase
LFPLGFGYPLGKGRYFDFFGVNYYTRDIVALSPSLSSFFGKVEVKENSPVNDLGWEIYSEGLYRLCKKYYNRFKAPIYITENGTCDSKDDFRAQYIYDHLYQVRRLLEEGIDVQRSYHWSLMDNFEWAEGLTPRFGLIEMNYDNLERKIRTSGRFYSDICKTKEVSEDMIRKYF